MGNLRFRGKDYKPSETVILLAVQHLARGYVVAANAYHSYHATGFSDWKHSLKSPDVGQQELVSEVTKQIKNSELHDDFIALRRTLDELVKVDEEISNWLASYVGINSIETRNERRNLDRKLRIIIAGGINGPQGPIWAINDEYRHLADKSKTVLKQITTLAEEIENRIAVLMQTGSQ